MARAARGGVSLTQLTTPGHDRCTEEFLPPMSGHKAPKSPTAHREWPPAGTTVRPVGTGTISSNGTSVPTCTQETH